MKRTESPGSQMQEVSQVEPWSKHADLSEYEDPRSFSYGPQPWMSRSNLEISIGQHCLDHGQRVLKFHNFKQFAKHNTYVYV